MRELTSPTAISICCCSPRSIVRYSGSVRSRGGISPGWPNWPKSSATQRRSKWSRTGCLTPRFCSILCSTFGGRRRASKWQGRVRCVAGWNAFSRQPRPLRSWAGASASGPQPSFCRLSSSLPARSPIAPCRCLRRRKSTRQCLRLPCASRSPSPSIHWAARRSSPSPGKATSCSARSAGSESSVWPRRAMAPIPTRRRPARSSWPSAMRGNQLARC